MTTRTSLLFLAVLVPLLVAIPAKARVSDDQAKQFIELFNEQPRAVRAGHELLPVNYVEYEGDSYGFAVSRRLARLAEAGETFRILRLNKKKQYLPEFDDPGVLRTIEPRRLLRLLVPYRTFLHSHGWEMPVDPKAIEYEELARLLTGKKSRKWSGCSSLWTRSCRRSPRNRSTATTSRSA